ncbi:helix-turn-helix domain-containing protein [Nocardioides sp.]|uniref:helix-turn-helix domain-containing protein n=1 Tax=Nocardioides sp. TaxID=35761 RepID=UPI003D0EBF67
MTNELSETACGCPIPTASTFHLGRNAGLAYRGSRELALSAIEFRVLATVVLARGRTVGAEELVAGVYGEHRVGSEPTARRWIREVRRKLGSPDPVRTVFCGGYAWDPLFTVSVCDRPTSTVVDLALG